MDNAASDGGVFTGPAHPHPTSVLINPAALGIGGFHQFLYIGGSWQVDRYAIQRQRVLDTNSGPQAGPTLQPLTMSPGGLLVAQFKTGRSAVLTAAVSMPMYESFIADQDDLGYHVLAGQHWQWAITAATSVRFNDRLYVGASLSRMSTKLDLSFYRDTALEGGTTGIQDPTCDGAACGIENPQAAERWDVSVDSQGILGTQTLSIRAGFAYQIARDWWLAGSYHSPPGLQAPLTLAGSARIERAPRSQTGDPEQDVYQPNAEIIYRLPSTLTLGVRGPITDSLQVFANARWQNLSSHRTLDLRVFGRDLDETIPEWYPRHRGLRDAFSVESGLETSAQERWRFGARVRVERGATAPAATAPLQVAGFNLSGALGARWRLLQQLSVTVDTAVSWFPTVTVENSDYDPLDRLTCVDNGFDIDDCAGAAEGRAISSAAGSYGRLGFTGRLSIRYTWD